MKPFLNPILHHKQIRIADKNFIKMVVSSVLTKYNKSVLWLTSIIKSQEKKDLAEETGVKEITSNAFNTAVSNSDRNAFILFYSPQCRHCKAFHPTWNQLGAMLKDENVDILKIDATSNNWPEAIYPVVKYPTLYWKHADKRGPERYTGGRTVRDLIKFVANKTELIQYDRNGNPKPKKTQ